VSALALAGGRHALHTLHVSAVERLTEDSVAITLHVPEALHAAFEFKPGQHVALVRPSVDDVRRSYSICSPVGGPLRVAVKALPGGKFSPYAMSALAPGDASPRISIPPGPGTTLRSPPGAESHR
jgi:ring-1,2-phenylacetyl-CoA epoxidase subunit PaaE